MRQSVSFIRRVFLHLSDALRTHRRYWRLIATNKAIVRSQLIRSSFIFSRKTFLLFLRLFHLTIRSQQRLKSETMKCSACILAMKKKVERAIDFWCVKVLALFTQEDREENKSFNVFVAEENYWTGFHLQTFIWSSNLVYSKSFSFSRSSPLSIQLHHFPRSTTWQKSEKLHEEGKTIFDFNFDHKKSLAWDV